MINALLIHLQDNVVVVTASVSADSPVSFVKQGVETQILAVEDIPVYHKVAIRDIARGEQVKKYGHVIGTASQDIGIGEHVHCHNIVSPSRKAEL